MRRPLTALAVGAGLVGCTHQPPPESSLHAPPLLPDDLGSDDSTEPTLAPTTTEATMVIATLPTTPPTTLDFALPERADDEYGDVEWLVRQTWPESPDYAAAVAACESSFDPLARNGQYWGVMQVGSVVHADRIEAMGLTPADLFDPAANLRVARAIYDEQGWRPWECAA